MKKGFTLIELIIIISIMSILAAVSVISYKYFIDRAREQCASARGYEIFEAVAWSYEDNENLVDTAKIVSVVKGITGFDIHIKDVSGKVITMDYIYDSIKYDIKADMLCYRFYIYYDVGGELIYEY
ncbi:MAG: prepilin-type N-terminal cleavage/methylation domain-containing protein [Bacillota bacterium]|nr:prepilin-type N-terminal cleavage/methylation domain-containing protein [Bacillota bacterium]